MSVIGEASLEQARLRFQDSRRALFLARLLGALEEQRGSSQELAQILRQVEDENGFDGPVPLINQATLLQMAYMTLVYPTEGPVGEILDGWEPNLDWASVEVLKDSGERFRGTSNWPQLLRTVRNSLAHSSVEITEGKFTFADRYRENEVAIAFEWEFLGQLTMEFFMAVNSVLYPDSSP